jgi:acid phosphatase family membrane protein YuiD
MNRALLTALATVGLTQFVKIPIAQMQTGRWDWSQMFKTGGMPSSHSAGVASLATYIGLKKGLSTVPFALATMLSLIVMYDAMGIRRQAGNIATEVNALEEKVVQLVEQNLPFRQLEGQAKDPLEERLGHLPAEVLAGAMLGVFTGALSRALEKPSPQRRLFNRLERMK